MLFTFRCTAISVQNVAWMFEIHYSRSLTTTTHACNCKSVIKCSFHEHYTFMEMSMVPPPLPLTLHVEHAKVGNDKLQLEK